MAKPVFVNGFSGANGQVLAKIYDALCWQER
jgi:hypothetical protein